MKTIIAGSRHIEDYPAVAQAVQDCGWEVTFILCGGAAGVDSVGEAYGMQHDIPVAHFPALWTKLDAPGSIIKIDRNGRKYNAKAGLDRNCDMADYADALILIWDGTSPGSRHMKSEAKKRGLLIHETILK